MLHPVPEPPVPRLPIRLPRAGARLLLCLSLLVPGCGSGDEGSGGSPASAGQAGSGTGAGSALILTEVTESSGVAYTCRTFVSSTLLHTPTVMGGGVAVFDADGDGDLDLFLTEGSPEGVVGGLADATTARLYLQTAPLAFEDATARSGIDLRGYGQGAAVGDYDNDGDLDLLALNYGRDQLLRNRGDGTFEDVTAAAGVENDAYSVSAAFFDYDRDGHLDLFIVRYIDFDPDQRCDDGVGKPEFCGPLSCPPVPDQLFRNRGDGTFEEVTEAAGIAAGSPAAGLGVVCQDFDHDGWIDLYVTNDAYANHLWMNQGDGTFREEAIALGAAFNLNSQAEAGMGVVSEDFDGNGWQDLFMTHLVKESNTLYRNLGAGRGFQDATGMSGLASSSMKFTGFGTAAGDLDLDGDLDLLIANGAVNHHDEDGGEPGLIDPWPRYAETNQIYLNDGTGRFALDEGSPFTSREEVSRGLVAADLEGDGDIDVIVVNLDSPTRIYRNDTPTDRAWLRVRAVDPELRRLAIGARIELADGGRKQTRTVTHAVGYGSAGPGTPLFALPAGAAVATVTWPTGEIEEFDLPPGGNQEVELRRGDGRMRE